jgi:GTP-binding protein
MFPYQGDSAADNAQIIEDELLKFSPTMAAGERWLVLNKLDLLPEEEVEERCQAVIDQLNWQGPVFRISGLTSTGTKDLCAAIMDHIDELRGREREDAELVAAEETRRNQMQSEARQRIEELAASRKQARMAQKEEANDDDDDDDFDVEVVYAE